MKAVRLNEFGDVDVLKIEDIEMPIPRSHHVLIKVDSTGVNYADVLRREVTTRVLASRLQWV